MKDRLNKVDIDQIQQKTLECEKMAGLQIRVPLGDSIILSNGVVILITGFFQGHVHFKVKAPQDILVLRKELLKTLMENKMENKKDV